jgi:hypothetical protein
MVPFQKSYFQEERTKKVSNPKKIRLLRTDE